MSETETTAPHFTVDATKKSIPYLLGPAFVAAIAYVDPGNVAANISSGVDYGYLLVWVLVLANLMAMLIQYQSAKLGLVTGQSMPEILGQRMRRAPRLAYWAQAEIVSAATDLAEVIGGAVALHLLFGIPAFVGGIIVGVVSLVLLLTQDRRSQRTFEAMIIGLLVIITIGFLCGLVVAPPSPQGVLGGLVPRFQGTNSVLLAASMLGATVMPHVIYLHSSLVTHRHGRDHSKKTLARLLKATRVDIIVALSLAGIVNIGLLLLAASALRKPGLPDTSSIEGAHDAIVMVLGPAVGVIFSIGLLASGLASTSVGAYAGSEVMKGMLHVQVPLWVRRIVTLIPALIILGFGIDPTWALVISQVVLSFGIPFALIPLQKITADASTMGSLADGRVLKYTSWVISALIIVLNGFLVFLVVTGQG